MTPTIDTVQRYEEERDAEGSYLSRDPDGDYVRYEDMAEIVAKYKKDAERYRWLRSMKRTDGELSHIIAGAPDCDGFIDEAMKKNPSV